MEDAASRAALAALIAERRESYAALSRMLGRNPAYLQQFVKRGSPRRLEERDRAMLARYFGVAEAQLGGPEAAREALVPVRRLDVAASAGPGRLAEDRTRAPMPFDPALLRQLGVRPAAASIVRVEGDSMLPTLADGDEILVDSDRRAPGARPALFVLKLDGAVSVKRVRAVGGGVEVASDNSAYPPASVVPPERVEVIGRVVWLGRALL